MHPSTMQYLKPNEAQFKIMEELRDAAIDYMKTLDEKVPDGPDKTYLLRQLREVAMWVNIAITRNPDGSARV